jgi:hypothetical protein
MAEEKPIVALAILISFTPTIEYITIPIHTTAKKIAKK